MSRKERFFTSEEEGAICLAVEQALEKNGGMKAHPFIVIVPGPRLNGLQIFTNQPPAILKEIVPVAAAMVLTDKPARVSQIDEKTGEVTELGADFFERKMH